ncbi:MAG: hypothetical protein ACI8RD_010469 [Bacillariaceae sp.]|jgi:hypothetical protein
MTGDGGPGDHASRYSGNPLAFAAEISSCFKYIWDDNIGLLDNTAQQREQQLTDG